MSALATIILKELSMPKIIKDGQVVENEWAIAELSADDQAPTGKTIVSLEYWNAHYAELQGNENIGLVLQPIETPEQIEGDLNTVPVIAVKFPAFADGRGFSIARLLRERYEYKGEIRAVGAPIRDQLTYLLRVGFNAFDLAEHYDPEEALASLKDFSENYQVAVDQPVPLFRRRG